MRTMPARSLQDQVAIVTGGSRGIGAALAADLARAGGRVVITGRDAARLEAVRQSIERASPEIGRAHV